MAGFEMVKNSEVKEDMVRNDGDIEKYYTQQKTISAIKDFQNIAKVVSVITGFTDMVRDGCFDEYSKALSDLEKLDDGSGLLDNYISVENAKELGTLIDQLSTLSSKISEFKYYNQNNTAAFDTTKYIVKKPVKVRITEKIIPKFTTIEYN